MATGDYAETGFLLGYGGWAAFRPTCGAVFVYGYERM